MSNYTLIILFVYDNGHKKMEKIGSKLESAS